MALHGITSYRNVFYVLDHVCYGLSLVANLKSYVCMPVARLLIWNDQNTNHIFPNL